MPPSGVHIASRPYFVFLRRAGAFMLAPILAATACGSSGEALPTPRPLIIHSGARITADPEKMEEVDRWIRDEITAIQEDPSFLVSRVEVEQETYPWDGLEIIGDTVRFRIEHAANDALTSYEIYAHLRLMEAMGRLQEWLPRAPQLDDYGREREIVDRTADSWLYGRAIFDAQPYRPLDELIYARDAGWLDAFIFTAQPDRFAAARAAWLQENPGVEEEYRSWFQDTFSRNPPGMRGEGESSPRPGRPAPSRRRSAG